MAKFCVSCGNRLNGTICACQNPADISVQSPRFAVSPQPEPVPVYDGFTYDPNSGLYYLTTPGNDESGQIGEWVTWFYPDTSEYTQSFTPDPNAHATVYTGQSVTATNTTASRSVKSTKKKSSLVHILMPVAGLALGVLIAFIRFGDLSGGETGQDRLNTVDNGQTQAGNPNPDTAASGGTTIGSVPYAARIASGVDSSMGLLPDGTVVVAAFIEPDTLAAIHSWNNIVAVATGSGIFVGLKSDGTVVAVSNSGSGRVSETDYWSNIIAISANSGQVIALRADGRTFASTPAPDVMVGGWSDIIAVAAGSDHMVGLKSDGTVVASGMNTAGQLDVDSWRNIIAISAGGAHTVGLRADGTVIAAGSSSAVRR